MATTRQVVVFTVLCLIVGSGCAKKADSQQAPVATHEDFFKEGLSAVNAHQFDVGVADFGKAINLNANFAPAYAARGLIYWNVRHDLVRALQDFSRAIGIDPRVADYYKYRAGVFSDKGDYSDAVSDFTEDLQLNPDDRKAYSDRGYAFLMLHKFKEAVNDMSHAILDNQDVEQNYNNRCYGFDKLGQYDNALVDCDNAITIDPGNPSSYDTRAGVYLHQKNYEKSWGDVKHVISLGGTPSPDMLRALQKESGRNEL